MNAPSSFNAAWLMQQVFPPTKYVVPGIIPEGMTLLVAAPKIGKSWMVLGLGVELSSGGNAFGVLPVGAPRPVLYLALEDGQRRLQDRLTKLNPSEISHRLEFITSMDGSSVIETIRNYVAKHAGLDPVVILDTLGKVMPAASGNESAYGHDYKMLSALKATCDAVPGSSLVIVHHTRKADGGDFLDAVSGTQGIAGAADTVMLLKRDRLDKRATLQVTSRDAAEGEYALTVSESGVWELDGHDLAAAAQAAETSKRTAGVGDRMAEVIEVVGRNPEGLTNNDLKGLMPDIPSAQLDKYLGRAVEAGRLERPRRGFYTPVRSVRSVSLSSQSLSSTVQPDTTDTPDTPLDLSGVAA
ncbi:hypothetical protein E3O55_13020 [Cryobacterium sp. MDB1-18-2]|uniref:AAA family ATPase n=1 Tax=unclassified Cryobacterium TaxID=2649013 RepID=UPI00106A4CF7|nr:MULTISPECIES: AAA family ATPase [unclassified Cryobacterium]TFC26995.1 hypothetical protein E3O55_13020 [Cryobacterium sp. MDB1-18-2]TFC44187.1 hypothetical protein E3O50_06035 [Cryobacterium sp. MDB1-18-1]